MEELIRLYDAYIKLLGDRYGDLMALAEARGQKESQEMIFAGAALRESIAKEKKRLETEKAALSQHISGLLTSFVNWYNDEYAFGEDIIEESEISEFIEFYNR